MSLVPIRRERAAAEALNSAHQDADNARSLAVLLGAVFSQASRTCGAAELERTASHNYR
jgi:hypothetical protein